MMCSLYITLSTTKLLDFNESKKTVTVLRVKMTKMF